MLQISKLNSPALPGSRLANPSAWSTVLGMALFLVPVGSFGSHAQWREFSCSSDVGVSCRVPPGRGLPHHAGLSAPSFEIVAPVSVRAFPPIHPMHFHTSSEATTANWRSYSTTSVYPIEGSGRGTKWDPVMPGGMRQPALVATPTPEPGTVFLLGSGLLGVGAFLRRRARRT